MECNSDRGGRGPGVIDFGPCDISGELTRRRELNRGVGSVSPVELYGVTRTVMG